MEGPGPSSQPPPASPARAPSPLLGSAPGASGYRGPAPRGVTYSDRFIPCRAVSARLDFSILDREAAASEAPRRASEREDQAASGAYNLLLRAELLGCPPAPPASPDKAATPASAAHPASPAKSPSRKLFRYIAGDADTPTAGLPTQSPYARGPIGHDGLGASALASPARSLRRIPRSPFKVPLKRRLLAAPGSSDGGSSARAAPPPPRHPAPPTPRPLARAQVLDAPALADDFYLNLVDWSAANVLAVGLGCSVYLWSACTSKVTRLVDYGEGRSVCSVAWSQRGSYLSVGTDRGDTEIWDAAKLKLVRSMPGHKQRVGCISWAHQLLATGSRDRSILLRDVRAPGDGIQRCGGHRSEVCGLRWSPDDRELASGGNDNQLLVWSAAAPAAPLLRFADHQAAVKAIAWSPHQHGLLASGGGTADRTIRFWNTGTGQALQTIDTGSQVCNLSWSKNANELVSTHGYSQNQIIVWRYPSMQKLATLTGHTMRVLYLAVSPDGQTIVTAAGAGDETLRFWNVFPGPKSPGVGADGGMGSMMRTLIR